MAKSTEDQVKIVADAMKHVAEHSKQTDTHWHEIGKVIETTTRHFDKGFLKAASSFTGLYPAIQNVGKAIASAFTGSDSHVQHMKAQIKELWERRRVMRDEDAKEPLRKQGMELVKQMKAGKVLTKDIGEIISSGWAIAAVAFAGELKLAFSYSKQINEQLIQTSADYATRRRLAGEIASIQAATGNEMADMVKGGAALAKYGFDVRAGFKDTLTTIVKMEEGLGVSYETSAELAVMARRIGGNFKDIADSVARIKADTALSADEATRFATQISKAVMMLKPGSGSLVSQTTDYISRIAAALKELTGNGQGFVDMLASFTTEQGMMGAATLGATPDFLANPAQVKKVTERFVKYVDQQLAGTSGFQRMATIQLLAEQFNTSADVVANANEMLKKYNETQRNKTSLEEEWRMQTSEIGKTLSKMYNSLAAIVQQVLTPAIRLLNPMLEVLTTGLQYVAKSGAALAAGGVLLAASLIGAVIATYKLTAAVLRYAGVAGFTGVSGGLAGKGGLAGTVMSWLPRIGGFLSRFINPITMVASAAVGGYALGKIIAKHTGLGVKLQEEWLAILNRKDAFRAASLTTGAGGVTRTDILKNVSAMAMSGKTAEEIQNYILKSASSVKGLHGESLTPERRQKILESIVQDAGREITRQRVRLGYTTLTDRTADDNAKDAQMIELYKAIAVNTAFTNKLLDRAEKKHENIEQTKQSIEDEQSSENRLKRQAQDRLLENMSRASGSRIFPMGF